MARVPLNQIAEAADVSVATVSKALNGRSDVSPQTRARVHEAARELGWTMRTPRGHTPTTPHHVAVVFDTVSNFYVPLVFEGILAKARELGIQVHVASQSSVRSGNRSHEAGSTSWINTMANQGIKGIMLVNVPTTAERVAACRQRGLSLVCVDPSTTPPPADITTIAATNYRGGLQATQHLIGLGHRRIGMVCGAWGSVPNDERMAGYLIALSSAGIVHDPTLVAAGDFRYEGGLVAGRYLLSLDDPPTAIFAQSDEMAMGVYEAARRLGVSIPGELSVVGFDDGIAAQYSAPPLTTVRQPLEQMGATAVVALNDMLAHRVPHPMELETKLVVRASTAAAPR